MTEFKENIEAANERGSTQIEKGPIAIGARYDRRIGHVVIDLNSGLAIMFKPLTRKDWKKPNPTSLPTSRSRPRAQASTSPPLMPIFT